MSTNRDGITKPNYQERLVISMLDWAMLELSTGISVQAPSAASGEYTSAFGSVTSAVAGVSNIINYSLY